MPSHLNIHRLRPELVKKKGKGKIITVPITLILQGVLWLGKKLIDYYLEKREQRRVRRFDKVVADLSDSTTIEEIPLAPWEKDALKKK